MFLNGLKQTPDLPFACFRFIKRPANLNSIFNPAFVYNKEITFVAGFVIIDSGLFPSEMQKDKVFELPANVFAEFKRYHVCQSGINTIDFFGIGQLLFK